MRTASCLLLLALGVLVAADAPAPKSPAATSAIAKSDAAVKRAQEVYRRALVEAKRQLLSDLESALAAAMKNGLLDEANAIKAVRDATAGELDELQMVGKLPYRIVEAKWGGGQIWADVTERVRELLENGEEVVATPDNLKADPTPGWKKELRVVVLQPNKKRTELRAGEGAVLGLKPMPQLP